MSADRRQIIAYSGVVSGAVGPPGNFGLTEYALGLARPRSRPRACYVPTAVGDAQAAIDAERQVFRERRPDVDLTVLTLFPQPLVPDVADHLLSQPVWLDFSFAAAIALTLLAGLSLRSVVLASLPAGPTAALGLASIAVCALITLVERRTGHGVADPLLPPGTCPRARTRR